jgi:sulfate adenylyltransferase subunit 2
VRRDEEPTRAKNGISARATSNMEWNVEDQPPELWDQFKTDFEPGTHIRIHPLLHWTELNIWEYIERENIPVIPLYFANERGNAIRSSAAHPCTFPIRSSPERWRRSSRNCARRTPRTRRPRSGQGERGRVRETAARRLHVNCVQRT